VAISGFEKAGRKRGALGNWSVLPSCLLAGLSVCAGALAAVPVSTSTAVLTWTAPTANVDGSALADLIGFNVYHGTSPKAMMMAASLAATASSYTESNLTPAVWYWYVTAVNSVGTESAPSPIISQTVAAPAPAPVPASPVPPTTPASPATPATPAPPVTASSGGSAQPPASTAGSASAAGSAAAPAGTAAPGASGSGGSADSKGPPWRSAQWYVGRHPTLCRPKGEVECFVNR
jgi:hypothetical protein